MSSAQQFLQQHKGAAIGAAVGLCVVAFSCWTLKMAKIPPPHQPTVKPIDLEECKARWRERLSLECPRTQENCRYLVVGAGFLGSRIVESLLQRGDQVTVFDFSPTCQWAKNSRVTFLQGDTTQLEDVTAACAGMQVVYMTAAIINFMDKLPHQYNASYRVNVEGTANVLAACNSQSVKLLVQTSTAHTVVPCGVPKGQIVRISEDSEYVTKESATSHYGSTKALAEELVIKANRSSNADGSLLYTVCIRPMGIFGSDDHLVMEPMLKEKKYEFCGFTMLMDW
jgi:nucleoside-diphosphate-sugar epimerase